MINRKHVGKPVKILAKKKMLNINLVTNIGLNFIYRNYGGWGNKSKDATKKKVNKSH